MGKSGREDALFILFGGIGGLGDNRQVGTQGVDDFQGLEPFITGILISIKTTSIAGFSKQAVTASCPFTARIIVNSLICMIFCSKRKLMLSSSAMSTVAALPLWDFLTALIGSEGKTGSRSYSNGIVKENSEPLPKVEVSDMDPCSNSI